MKIRIKFRKYGTMKFIGHLDVMRYFQKAIRRADVDVCYSGGFSPHQIMSFAAPLGVGITSRGEYVDIEVASTKDSETMKKCLNGVMSEGFEIVSYRGLPDDAANAMSIVGAGDYTLAFRPGYEPEDMDKETWFQGLIAFFERPSVMVTKKTKRGEKEMDLKPLVYELRICPEGGWRNGRSPSVYENIRRQRCQCETGTGAGCVLRVPGKGAPALCLYGTEGRSICGQGL